MKRVLLTGASGFLGREILPLLLAAGAEIHTIGRSEITHPAVTHHRLDLLGEADFAAVEAIGASHLVHLAWFAEPGRFWTAPENHDWVAASNALVRAFSAGGGKRAVVAGSCAEYQWGPSRLDEARSPIAPAMLYGSAKASLYAMLAEAAPALSLSLAWPRLFFPYGPFERRERLLGTLLAALDSGEVARFTAGRQRRDFIHVEDAASAFVAILAAPIEGAVNVASGEAVEVRRFVEIAAAAAGIGDQLAFDALPLGADEPAIIEGAIDRLTNETDYRPRFTLAEGLADAVTKFRARG